MPIVAEQLDGSVGTEVGLGPGDTVSYGDPDLPHGKGRLFFAVIHLVPDLQSDACLIQVVGTLASI